MISVCIICKDTKVVSGPRNQKTVGCCLKCKPRALMMLAEEGMLEREEADELDKILKGEK